MFRHSLWTYNGAMLCCNPEGCDANTLLIWPLARPIVSQYSIRNKISRRGLARALLPSIVSELSNRKRMFALTRPPSQVAGAVTGSLVKPIFLSVRMFSSFGEVSNSWFFTFDHEAIESFSLSNSTFREYAFSFAPGRSSQSTDPS